MKKISIDQDIIDSFSQTVNDYSNSSSKTATTSTGTSYSVITSKDTTTAKTTLPNAGIRTVIICIVLISIIGIVVYIRYANLKKYMK